MTSKGHWPGDFPDISNPSDYQRLVALAKRRLVGFEHHAEDVVSRAIIKWSKISADRRGVARIEQVIKSEAYSYLRSERRYREREARATADRSSLTGRTRPPTDQDMVVLRQALAETGRRAGIAITALDVEVLELLLAGYSISEIVRRGGYSRHGVRNSRRKWQLLVRRTVFTDPATEAATVQVSQLPNVTDVDELRRSGQARTTASPLGDPADDSELLDVPMNSIMGVEDLSAFLQSEAVTSIAEKLKKDS